MNASMETVQALLIGSDRINQMKTEIVSVIRMIFGFISKEEIEEFGGDRKIFSFGTGLWMFKVFIKKGELIAEFCSSESPMRPISQRCEVGLEDSRISLALVEVVHSCLPDFLSNMCRCFPELENRLAPLFKAAGK
ncbi:MAG: hypothetical protein Q8Q90_03850 [bacterium]|nr:hypothetical protein [bacterium]